MTVFPFLLSLMLLASGHLAAIAPAYADDGPKSREHGQSAKPTAPQPMIILQGERLSVRLFNSSWNTVAKELERQTGITIRTEGSLAGTLTDEFEAVPLEEGLRRLFRNANVVLFYAAPLGPSEARLTHVWLFPKGGGAGEREQTHATRPGVATTQPAGEVGASEETAAIPGEGDTHPTAEGDQAERVARLHALAEEGDVAALQQAVFAPDQTLQMTAFDLLIERDHHAAIALLLSATKGDQSERRLQALDLLYQTGQADEGTMLSALSNALADEDANVKGYAVRILAERRWPGTAEQLRQLARDPDPATRMLVIEHVVSDEDGLILLQELLSDDDETVSSAAASKFEQTTGDQ